MTQLQANQELTDAIEQLYQTLAVPQKIDGHVWYGEDDRAMERRLKKVNRRNVSVADINVLFINNCDSVQSLKYYLPRALDLLAGGERYISEFFVAMKVKQAGFEQWPAPEQAALVRVLRAMNNTGNDWLIAHTVAHFDWINL